MPLTAVLRTLLIWKIMFYSESSDERENGMGPDFVRYFDSEQSYECQDCGKIIRISGWKREYPMGAFDSEDVDVALRKKKRLITFAKFTIPIMK